jgi:hypothetical protein
VKSAFIMQQARRVMPRLELRSDSMTFGVLRKYGMRGPLRQHLDHLAMH